MTLRRDLEYFENLGQAVRNTGRTKYLRSLSEQEDVYALRAAKIRGKKQNLKACESTFYRAPPLGLHRCRLYRNVLGKKSARLNYSVVTSGNQWDMDSPKDINLGNGHRGLISRSLICRFRQPFGIPDRSAQH